MTQRADDLPMALQLNSNYSSRIPLSVDGICPTTVSRLSESEISALPVRRGRHVHRLDDFFDVSGSAQEDETIEWRGNLGCVQHIGRSMTSGKVIVESAAGDFIGAEMAGGQLLAHGDVGDFAGLAMAGGQLTVLGSAGDHLASVHPGAKRGMNRGTIWVQGDAGAGVGQSMRRGTIVIGGNIGPACGWNMIAGTLLALGSIEGSVGVGMRRGTIINANRSWEKSAEAELSRSSLLPSFAKGPCHPIPILRLLQRSLRGSIFESEKLAFLGGAFQLYHGDQLHGGHGEYLIAQPG